MSSYTPEQQRAIESDANLVVTAGAGAGKTRVLTQRWIRLLMDESREIDQVVAITFTEKAAAEMLERCRKELRLLGSPRAKYLLERLDQARISTFHSFCQSVLRLYPVEAGLDPDFRVADELEAAALLGEAVEESLTAAAQVADEAVIDLFTRFGRTRLSSHLARLISQMRNLGETPDSLRAATRAALHHTPDPRPVAASVAALLACETKPGSKGAEQKAALRETWASLEPRLGAISTELVAGLKAMAEAINGNALKPKKPLVDAIEAVEAALATAEAVRVGLAVIDLLEATLERYAARKDQLNLLDFSDLIERLRRLLESVPSVREDLVSQNLIFLNDEVQDTDPSQWQVIRQMLIRPGEAVIPPGRVFIVGDPKQSIYKFRGARVEVFGAMTEQVAPLPEQRIGLMKNFRSQGGLIRFVNHLFAQLMGAAEGAGAVPYAPMEWHRPEQERVVELLLSQSPGAEGRREEAAQLAARIRQMVEGGERLVHEREPRPVRYGDVAILVQAMTHVREYADALAAAGVPYYVVAGDGFFQAQEVQDVANLLTVLDDPGNTVALTGWLRSPHVGLSDNTIVAMALHEQGFSGAWADESYRAPGPDEPLLARARGLMPRLRQLAWQEPLPRLLPALFAELGLYPVLLAQPDGASAVANLEKLAALAAAFGDQGRHQFSDLRRWLQTAMEAEAREGLAATEEEGGDNVRIMTVHKSKGLEFPVVALPDLGRSQRSDAPEILLHPQAGVAPRLTTDDGEEVPSALRRQALDLHRQESEQEFRRLFYVAVTRARDYVILSAIQPRPSASGADGKATWLHWLFAACNADVAAPPAELTCGDITLPVRTATAEAVELQEEAAATVPIRPGQATDPSPEIAALLRQAAPPERRGARTDLQTSASRLMVYQDCPRKYYLQTVLALPDLRRAPTGWDALARDPADEEEIARESVIEPTVRGTIVHAVCERLTDPGDLEALIAQALRENEVPFHHPDVEMAIREPLRRYVAGDLFRRLRGAREVYSELPFRLDVGEMVLEGFIDKVLVENDGAVVIDFKTNHVLAADQIDEAAAHYRLQMQIYALAVQQKLGLPVKDALLHFLAPGVSRSVKEHLHAEAVREELRTMGARLRTATDWEEYPPAVQHCAHCQYRTFCRLEPTA